MNEPPNGSTDIPLFREEYQTVIGLEIHCQLSTITKAFCRCGTKEGQAPNSQTCPVCQGLPGVLPVLNKKAVEFAIRMGLATRCQIANKSSFARKNYFYPDMPKGYQITQYEKPICQSGEIVLPDGKSIGISRIHLEEDAGKNLHYDQYSLVDLNRAGIPLLEIVSDPDIRTPHEAELYMRQIHSLVRYLDICQGDLEKGHFRCDANVSIRNPDGSLGIRTEVKNVNSFNYIEKALTAEINRQMELIGSGRAVRQETRTYDEKTNQTVFMRLKEQEHDYRYFPEPDLPTLVIDQQWIQKVAADLPELPEKKIKRFINKYKLRKDDAVLLCVNKQVADYFEKVVSYCNKPPLVCNWMLGEMFRLMNKTKRDFFQIVISPAQLAELILMIENGIISGKIGKNVLEKMFESGKSPRKIVNLEGLNQISDQEVLDELIDKVLNNNQKQLDLYRKGKTNLFDFFVGQVMKLSDGKANPALVQKILKRKLDQDNS